jgi:hypothetical protein
LNESAIKISLSKIRDEFSKLPSDSLVDVVASYKPASLVIDGDIFTSSVWIDQVGNDKLLIVALSKKRFFLESVYCLGFKLTKGTDIEYLSNEQLWEMGIP